MCLSRSVYDTLFSMKGAKNFFTSHKHIIIAFIFAFSALFFAWYSTYIKKDADTTSTTPIQEELSDFRASKNKIVFTENEHIMGNPQALVFLVVYTDFQCPFCTEYHRTLRRIIEFYGPSGDVALVYRHMPLVQLHPDSAIYAHGAECAYDAGGEKAFWHFVDALFVNEETQNAPDPSFLTSLAVNAGANASSFVECMREEKYKEKIDESFSKAWDMGIRATPHTILITPHQELVLEEMRSYTVLASALDVILRSLKNSSSPFTEE
jgi:protein-disulfide isomerase